MGAFRDEKSLHLSSLNDCVLCSCFTDNEHGIVTVPLRGFDAFPNIPEGMPILAKKNEFDFIHFWISGSAAAPGFLEKFRREKFRIPLPQHRLYCLSVGFNLKLIHFVCGAGVVYTFIYLPPYYLLLW